jgi:hypothetical protein
VDETEPLERFGVTAMWSACLWRVELDICQKNVFKASRCAVASAESRGEFSGLNGLTMDTLESVELDLRGASCFAKARDFVESVCELLSAWLNSPSHVEIRRYRDEYDEAKAAVVDAERHLRDLSVRRTLPACSNVAGASSGSSYSHSDSLVNHLQPSAEEVARRKLGDAESREQQAQEMLDSAEDHRSAAAEALRASLLAVQGTSVEELYHLEDWRVMEGIRARGVLAVHTTVLACLCKLTDAGERVSLTAALTGDFGTTLKQDRRAKQAPVPPHSPLRR